MGVAAAGGLGVSDIDQQIERELRRLAKRRRWLLAIRAAAVGVAACGLWLLIACLIDRFLLTPPALRAASRAAWVLLLLWAVARTAWPLLQRRFDPLQAARWAEAVDPLWGERLSTFVTQTKLPAPDRASVSLMNALRTGLAHDLTRHPPADRVRVTASRPILFLPGVVLLLWLVAWLVPALDVSRLVERQLRPWADLPPVTSTRIELASHPATLAQGKSLAVVVDLNQDVTPVLLHVGPDAKRLRPLEMERTYEQRYTLTLPSPQEDFVYRVTAGDATSDLVPVRVLRRPGVSAIDVDLTFAAGRPMQKWRDSDGQIRASAGTNVRLQFRSTEPLRSATVRVGDAAIPAQPDAARRTWHADFVARQDAALSIALISERGVEGGGPPGMRLIVEPESPAG
jgi:hypothetical protein